MLGETLVTVTGSAGGSIDNAKETATFNASTLSASKTELKALGPENRMERGLPDRSIPDGTENRR